MAIKIHPVCLLICFFVVILSGCDQRSTSAGVIRFDIQQRPNIFLNDSPDDIEILQPIQEYYQDKFGWGYLVPVPGVVLSDSLLGSPIPVASGGKTARPGLGVQATCDASSCQTTCDDPPCDILEAYLYRIKGNQAKTFIVYSVSPLYIDQSPFVISVDETFPFRFSIKNNSAKKARLCWLNTEKKALWGWNSRLERKTNYGTWEAFSTTQNLCASGYSSGIWIPAGETSSIDATSAYPNYQELPKGIYRWAIVLDGEVTPTLIFSPEFKLGQ